jgi:hypothetical protein
MFSAFFHNLWEKEAKMSKKNSFFRVLACSVLFSFLFVAAPEYYDECEDLEDLDSGVCLDLFAIPQDSAASATIRKDSPSICFFSNFCSTTHLIQYYQSPNIYSQPFTSELILSVTLRC